MLYNMAALIILAMIFAWANGTEKILTRPVDLDLTSLCMPNCQCTEIVADCVLEYCEQEFEKSKSHLILRGPICPFQWKKLEDLEYHIHVELHNAKCRHLPNCE